MRNIEFACKKVLLITPFNPKGIGGAETFANGLIHEVMKKDIHMSVATLPIFTNKWDEPGPIEAIHVFVRLLWKSLSIMRRQSIDTIHTLGIISTIIGATLKQFFDIRLISTTLALYGFNNWSGLKGQIARWAFNACDIVFVEDHIGRQDMELLGIPSSKIRIFTHWVDTERFRPGKREDRDYLNILYIGRPIPKKGKHIIEEAERQLHNEKAKVAFAYIENVAYEHLPNHYRDADIFVIPSIYNEGVARVVLEAAASGCAVISSNAGSLERLVKPFGIVVEPLVSEFVRVISNLCFDPGRLDQYKFISRTYAEKHFNSKNAMAFIEEY